MTRKRRIPKVGFDLDGVILYNPTRVARPIIATVKRVLFGRRKTKFYLPKSNVEKQVWNIFHASSLFIERGYERVKILLKNGDIEGYIVTARYGFLQDDFDKWKVRLEADEHFAASYANLKNEQPHVYKQRMIEKLDLDYFIEDNWDIVRALSTNPKNKHRKIIWIYNMLDRLVVSHPLAFPNLQRAIAWIEEDIQQAAPRVVKKIKRKK